MTLQAVCSNAEKFLGDSQFLVCFLSAHYIVLGMRVEFFFYHQKLICQPQKALSLLCISINDLHLLNFVESSDIQQSVCEILRQANELSVYTSYTDANYIYLVWRPWHLT